MTTIDYVQLSQDWSIAFFSVLFFYFLGLAVGSVVNTIRRC